MEIGQIQHIVPSHRKRKDEGYCGAYYRYEFCIRSIHGYGFDFDRDRQTYNVEAREYTKIGVF